MTNTNHDAQSMQDAAIRAITLAITAKQQGEISWSCVAVDRDFVRSEIRDFAEAAVMAEQLRPEDLAFRVNAIQ